MEQTTQIVLLLDTYEKLLTDTQARILRMRFDDDLSLGEIGEECGISRQAARDAIRKGEEKLLFFEQTLHLVARKRASRTIAEDLRNGALSPEQAAEALESIAEDSDGV